MNIKITGTRNVTEKTMLRLVNQWGKVKIESKFYYTSLSV